MAAVDDIHRRFLSEPANKALQPSAVQRLSSDIADELRGVKFRSYWPSVTAAVVLVKLRAADLNAEGLRALMADLKSRDLLSTFYWLAHPRNSSEFAPWLAAHGVKWAEILAAYEWSLSDSLDVFFGVFAGALLAVGQNIVDSAELAVDGARILAKRPETAARIAALLNPVSSSMLQQAGLLAAVKAALDKGAAAAPAAYISTVYGTLLENFTISGVLEGIAVSATQWMATLDRYMMNLEFFKAGMHIGRVIGTVCDMIEGGIGFAKLFPKLASKGAALTERVAARMKAAAKAGAATREAELLVQELRAVGAVEKLPIVTVTPKGLTSADVSNLIERGGVKELPDGTTVMWIPCSH